MAQLVFASDYRIAIYLHRKCFQIPNFVRRSLQPYSQPLAPICTSTLGGESGTNGDRVRNGGEQLAFSDSAVLLYRWPTMVHFRVISRLKMYQLALMTAALPYLLLKYKMGEVTGYSVSAGFAAAVGTSGILLALTQLFMRVVGEMKYDPDSRVVRLGMLTFWGNRVDHYIPVDKIVQFNESQTKMGGACQRLRIEGRKKDLLYSLRYGGVANFKLMCEVLGITREDLKYFKS